MATHDLKSWPANFAALLNGRQFEVRRADRQFALGDYVHLSEYLPTAGELTGRTLDFVVDDVAPFGIPGEAPSRAFVMLHYRRIVQQVVTTAPAPVPKLVDPVEQELCAKIAEANRVMQVILDERGELHQVFGTGMAQDAKAGATGRLAFHRSGFLNFQVLACDHTFSVAGLVCSKCGIPRTLTPAAHDTEQ